MLQALQHTHSGLRWIVLLLIIAAVVVAAGAMSKPLSASAKKISLFALIATHTQVVIGLLLYLMNVDGKVQFSSETMKNSLIRFFTVEHVLMMLIAVILVTIGNRQAKSGNGKKMFWYYFIALVIIIAAIPWPFRAGLGGTWF